LSLEFIDQAERLPDSKLSLKIGSEEPVGGVDVRVAVRVAKPDWVAGTTGVDVTVAPVVGVDGTGV
jgi:hypothetical protein